MKAENKDQNANLKKEIEKALTNGSIDFEDVPEDNASPLNHPVVEKDLNIHSTPKEIPQYAKAHEFDQEDDSEEQAQDEPLDAPEQEISQASSSNELPTEDEVEIPIEHAQIAADTFLGMTDNLFEVGGGFFVKIRKHEDFYDFDEVVQVIDEQNEKNVRKLKLDEEDKALLRPLLVIIIRKRAKRLTPEQQLAGAAISILIKKAKLAVEMRAENNLLVERIRDIIKQETGNATSSEPVKTESDSTPKPPQNPEFASVLEVAD